MEIREMKLKFNENTDFDNHVETRELKQKTRF